MLKKILINQKNFLFFLLEFFDFVCCILGKIHEETVCVQTDLSECIEELFKSTIDITDPSAIQFLMQEKEVPGNIVSRFLRQCYVMQSMVFFFFLNKCCKDLFDVVWLFFMFLKQDKQKNSQSKKLNFSLRNKNKKKGTNKSKDSKSHENSQSQSQQKTQPTETFNLDEIRNSKWNNIKFRVSVFVYLQLKKIEELCQESQNKTDLPKFVPKKLFSKHCESPVKKICFG